MIENSLEAGGLDQVQEPIPVRFPWSYIYCRVNSIQNDYVQWTIDTFPKGESKAAEKTVKQTLAL